MANTNKQLATAKSARFDDFYTMYEDVDKEVSMYSNYFKGKVVYCNCDDPSWSSFAKYFINNFDRLGLKELICTHYEKDKQGYVERWTSSSSAPTKTMLRDNNRQSDENCLLCSHKEFVQSNGSFDDDECLDLLDECDIVVTNPPFSLWVNFMNLLLEKGKDFLILGPLNNIDRVDFKQHFISNKIRCGYNWVGWFVVPDYYMDKKYSNVKEDKNELIPGTGWKHKVHINAILWYTNLPTNKDLPEYKTGVEYREGQYYHAYNHDAINVDLVANIPDNYNGVIGVPLSFITKLNRKQYQLIDIVHCLRYQSEDGFDKQTYTRLLIKKIDAGTLGQYHRELKDWYKKTSKDELYFYTIITPQGLKVGTTNNPARRWKEHYSQTESRYTMVYGPFKKENALCLERAVQSLFRRANDLSDETFNPWQEKEIECVIRETIYNHSMYKR